MTHSEVPRQLLHIGVGVLALSLVWVTWWQAAGIAAAAVVFNRFALQRVSPRIRRRADVDHPWRSGLVLYPAAVLGLVLIFRDRLDMAAAAWGILAAGDGMATLIGTTVASPRLPWNREKSVAGLIAFVAAAAPAALGLLVWTAATPLTGWLVATVVLAAAVAGFVETIPIQLDDNVTVPAAAALVLWSCSMVDPLHLAARVPELTPLLVYGLVANTMVASLGWLVRTVTAAGAITGALIGTLVVAGAGWGGWGVLMATFVLASLSTRMGQARKTNAGIAEERGGRRGPGNALANTGLAAWASFIAAGLPDPTPAWLVAVAALATAGSDTVASEIGKAFGRTTWLVTTFKRVPPGTTGAISAEGTLAGVIGAALLASLGAALGLVPLRAIAVITIAATVASVVEGLLGATLEARGILNNDTLNFTNAAMGAALTLAVWMWWPLA
jgi:uncharacterized protein (TIGR00297 family)